MRFLSSIPNVFIVELEDPVEDGLVVGKTGEELELEDGLVDGKACEDGDGNRKAGFGGLGKSNFGGALT